MSKTLAKRLFFSHTLTLGAAGNRIEIQGVFLNRVGRNLPWLVLGSWATALLLAVWICRAA